MRVLIVLLLSLWLAPAWAQVPMTGAGKGASGGAAYSGPGNVFTTSPLAGYSCSRVFTTALASTSTNLCDLVAITGGAAVCTLRASSTGFVDQSAYCPGGLTPSAACAAASGGSCRVSKVYDQIGTNHMVQVTLASMPGIVFNSTPSGTLPAIDCEGGAYLLTSTSSVTQAQPFTLSIVYIRTTGTAQGGAYGGASFSALIGSAGSANNAIALISGALVKSATDATWHSLSGLFNGGGTSSAINVDGSDTTGALDTTGFSSTTMRLCRAGASQLAGKIAEAWMWAAASTSTDRNNVSTNQHSSTDGYNF